MNARPPCGHGFFDCATVLLTVPLLDDLGRNSVPSGLRCWRLSCAIVAGCPSACRLVFLSCRQLGATARIRPPVPLRPPLGQASSLTALPQWIAMQKGRHLLLFHERRYKCLALRGLDRGRELRFQKTISVATPFSGKITLSFLAINAFFWEIMGAQRSALPWMTLGRPCPPPKKGSR